MPAKVEKVGGRYQVRTPNGLKARGTSKEKAQKQVRLLEAIDHGWKPKKRGK